jgi:2-oxo-4-hydroxy-4-carboxy-5-ureidoimidazoline decarboxylase
MKITELNAMPAEALAAELTKCCGSSAWVQKMLEVRPFTDADDLLAKAHACWADCSEEDGLEAFEHHPKIGASELAQKFASTADWAAGEQSGVQKATPAVIKALAARNAEYEQKFGYIFIVCATGKSAEEMLQLLEQRLPNIPEIEIGIAMAEQMKITVIRLQKLLAS